MPSVAINGVDLYYEEAGSGSPILFIHELAGDYRSWEPQMRHFARNHRCIVYSARGYHPSSVPDNEDAYSQRQAADDAVSLLDRLGIDRAHIVGLSMGSFTTLHFGIYHPKRALSLTIVGCGSGSAPETFETSQRRYKSMGEAILQGGFEQFVDSYAGGEYRLSFKAKDPRGWAEFRQRLAEHSAFGKAMTLMNVQGKRPCLYDMEDEIRQVKVPALVVCGDLDQPCIQPSIYLARTLQNAGLCILPKTSHTVNLEEPEMFNTQLQAFLAAVGANSWCASYD